MLRDTTPASVETKANVFNMSVEEKDRRELCIKNRDFFYDRSKQYLNLINSDVDPSVLNIVAPIIKKKVSLLYNRPLVREFKGPSKSVSFLKSFYGQYKIDRFLRNVDLAAELTGTGLVFVGRDEAKTYLRIYDAADFSVIENEDDQEDIDAVSLVSVKTALEGKNPKDPQARRFLDTQIWTNDSIVEYQDGVRSVVKANELGVLPFVAFKGEEVYNQFLGHAPATSIVNLNSDINQQLTNINYMVKMQAGSPIAITGFERGEGLQVHPGLAISLPVGAKAEVLQFNPKIADSLAIIQFLEQKIYEHSSIPKISIVGDSEATSGKQLQIKWSPLINVFKEKSSRYENYELNLANMILKVNNLPEIQSIAVKYPEENILPLTDDVADIQILMEMGLTTPIEQMMRMNPYMTETEAEAEVRANVEFNKSINPEPDILAKGNKVAGPQI